MEDKKVCKKCGGPKKMYYKLFCPLCDKPELETKQFYNLFRCMYHIEALGHPGFKDRIWDYLGDQHNISNDVYVEIWNDPDPEYGSEDVQLLFDTFGIKDEHMLFFISW